MVALGSEVVSYERGTPAGGEGAAQPGGRSQLSEPPGADSPPFCLRFRVPPEIPTLNLKDVLVLTEISLMNETIPLNR